MHKVSVNEEIKNLNEFLPHLLWSQVNLRSCIAFFCDAPGLFSSEKQVQCLFVFALKNVGMKEKESLSVFKVL